MTPRKDADEISARGGHHGDLPLAIPPGALEPMRCAVWGAIMGCVWVFFSLQNVGVSRVCFRLVSCFFLAGGWLHSGFIRLSQGFIMFFI